MSTNLRPRRLLLSLAVVTAAFLGTTDTASAAGRGQPTDWDRFLYYPYVYYPHNFQSTPESYDHMYYRYGTERRIPVYNKDWHNFYPSKRAYHSGNHFILDVF